MKVLLVEDEDAKRDNIRSLVCASFPDIEISMAKSVRSAIKAIRTARPDLLLLDMSLPTFDIAPNESGGRPQGFGGIEVLRYLQRFNISIKTIVVTAYEAFYSDDEHKDVNLTELSDELMRRHGESYVGLIYYNSIYGDWEQKLFNALSEIKGAVQ